VRYSAFVVSKPKQYRVLNTTPRSGRYPIYNLIITKACIMVKSKLCACNSFELRLRCPVHLYAAIVRLCPVHGALQSSGSDNKIYIYRNPH